MTLKEFKELKKGDKVTLNKDGENYMGKHLIERYLREKPVIIIEEKPISSFAYVNIFGNPQSFHWDMFEFIKEETTSAEHELCYAGME